jgi:hypothetical protein
MPGLAKYLPEFGWQPIILTTPLGEKPDSRFGPPNDFKNDIRTIETGNSSAPDGHDENILIKINNRFDLASQKSLSFLKFFYNLFYIHFYQAIVNYPDSEKGWKLFALKAGSELLQKEDIDAIISSSSPVTSHLIAKELKNRYRIPWIADLRDLWSQNHDYSYGPLRKMIDRRLELNTLLSADALVTVSPLWAEELRTLHKREAVYTITNGFDPDKVMKGQMGLTSKFTITYTGQVIYAGKQDPSKLFATLQELITDGTINPKDVEVRFYNPENELLARGIEEYELSAVAKQYGIVPREISFEKQRESQLLLLLNWEDQRERGWYPLKIFEYLAAQRPILSIGGSGDDVVKRLLDETKAGMYAPSVDIIKSILKEVYLEYKHKGKVSYDGNMEKIDKYSYREMARKFAEILDSLTQKDQGVDK